MLHCTLVRGPAAGRGPARPQVLSADPMAKPAAQPVIPAAEVSVRIQPGAPGADLATALAQSHGTQPSGIDQPRVGGKPLDELVVGDFPLVNGCVIVDGVAAVPQNSHHRSHGRLHFVVHSGPGAGLTFPLTRGRYSIGRNNADITIPDPSLSRHHAWLEVAETNVVLQDAGSANGSFVDSRAVAKTAVDTSSLIELGSSWCSLALNTEAELPAEAGADVSTPIEVSVRADAAQTNKTTIALTAGLPLLIGVGLAVITGMWMFLAFTAVSAVSVLIPLVSGRRRRQRLGTAVAAAVAQDEERRRRSAPALPLILGAPTVRDVPEPLGPLSLRLGTTVQSANIKVSGGYDDFEPPEVGRTPLVLVFPRRPVLIRGSETQARGLIAALLAQVATYPAAAGSTIFILTAPGHFSRGAQFLPGVTLSTNPLTALTLFTGAANATESHTAPLKFFVSMMDTPLRAEIENAALTAGFQLIKSVRSSAAESANSGETTIKFGERNAQLLKGESSTDFVADVLSNGLFDKFCRSHGAGPLLAETLVSGLPAKTKLGELLSVSSGSTEKRWSASEAAAGLPVTLGASATGNLVVDLKSDGPHFLVAGTTGSGKSELLRTLVASAALSFPPSRVNFLFFDFKGGSGLDPLAGLPHCVGVVTDLAQEELERTLASLRAEVRRREALLASVSAPDLEQYRVRRTSSDEALPNLFIVIDEFRMLVDEAPAALTELMRIATIGRSLGIQLIMATQRPSGALNSDIRANVTTSIALRVQSEMESLDILNRRDAAHIPVQLQGRAYIARGTAEPELFQTAELIAATEDVIRPGIEIFSAEEAMHMGPSESAMPLSKSSDGDDPGCTPSNTPTENARPIVEMTTALWAKTSQESVRRPVAPPLPRSHSLAPAEFSNTGEFSKPGDFIYSESPAGPATVLGLTDYPDRQQVASLRWNPLEHGNLGIFAPDAQESARALAVVTSQLLNTRPAEKQLSPTKPSVPRTPSEMSAALYLLDGDGQLASVAEAPTVGAHASLYELRRGVRILERLASHIVSSSAQGPEGAQSGKSPLVLVISSWGAWLSALRSSAYSWAEDLVSDIVRDGPRAGVFVVISGDRELSIARFSPALASRLYCPYGASEDSKMMWPKLPATSRIPGRTVANGALTEGTARVTQIFEAPDLAEAASNSYGTTPPALRIMPLPSTLTAADMDKLMGTQEAQDRPQNGLVIGVAGDEGKLADVPFRLGMLLLVLGSPESGKSSFLTALQQCNPQAGHWLPLRYSSSTLAQLSTLREQQIEGSLPADSILVIDDVEQLEIQGQHLLMELHHGGLTMVLATVFSPVLLSRVPVSMNARSSGCGIILAPRSVNDADIFGLRFDVEPRGPRGRGVLISRNEAISAQFVLEAA
ncbi:FtsK/SpoIIIE domain-containing protein [Pseudarthrobacter sp. J1738]|uniref:FtsK/SpoIIIE domain-containing protein n=1 Tax=Pseudarthrobacter sp. J1738 TaxID=3420446 RepID=UPI003D288464